MINLDDGRRSAVEYCSHVENEGRMDWVRNGEVAGTVGEQRRIEAIQIRISSKKSRNNSRYDDDKYNSGRSQYDNDNGYSGNRHGTNGGNRNERNGRYRY